MTVARSVGDVLTEHVQFEIECIDRMYCNVYVPHLQFAAGLIGYIQRQLGLPIASTAPPMDPSPTRSVQRPPLQPRPGCPGSLRQGQRKDDVAQAFGRFTDSEGVLFVGRAQEKALVWRTQRRYSRDGASYAWLVPSTAFVNHFYFYCVDDDFGPFVLNSVVTSPTP